MVNIKRSFLFKNKNSCTHFMVVTGYNRNEIDAKNRYIVLDPLGTTFSQAKGLKFGLCPIYKMENAWHMEFDDMVTITITLIRILPILKLANSKGVIL